MTEISSNSPSSKPGGAGTPFAAMAVAAVLLPPLALFLLEGVSRNFWIAFALTCLGYVPGAAFALYMLLNRSRRPAAAA
jgi:uncharacterized membrane protein YqaE (UPF0057 family)